MDAEDRTVSYGAESSFGQWSHDATGLPCFVLTATAEDHPYHPFRHLMATGKLGALADRWGNLSLFTTDGGDGYVQITHAMHQCRSGLYPMLRIGEDWVSLLYGELQRQQVCRYGVGYAEYLGNAEGRWGTVAVEQGYYAAPDALPGIRGEFTLRNVGPSPIEAELVLCGDCTLVDRYHQENTLDVQTGAGEAILPKVHPGLGDFFLLGPKDAVGQVVSSVAIGVAIPIRLAPDESMSVAAMVGYGRAENRQDVRSDLRRRSADAIRLAWADVLGKVDLDTPEAWMRDECIWTYSQLLSFRNYDASLGEHYLSLGGYGWGGFNQRELGETALVVSPWHGEIAAESLRFMARTQYPNGDMPSGHNFTVSRLPEPAPPTPTSSDTEIWYLLGLAEYATCEGDLGQTVPYRDGSEGDLWDHAKRAFYFLRDRIGVGAHGLVKFWQGDWNDYLFPMGEKGRGESMMNTGMACKALGALAPLAEQRGDTVFAEEMRAWRDELRRAAAESFDETHFLRGYTDAGKPIGGRADDRVFLNAQSWPVLGGCGSDDQRKTALRTALDACHDPKGLCLVSRPFASPPPADVSSLPIPAGQGENGGVWPQTVAWFLWAMAEEGLTDEALAVWRRMTLRHHALHCPDTPFGIFNGPDCYNSHLAGPLAHWTQVQLWDRRLYTPMNPAVAWQAFAMRKILTSAART